MNMSLQFEFPANLTVEEFINSLNDEATTQLVSRQPFCKTYYDSFDWRLYSNDISCEFDQARLTSLLTLRSIKTGLVIANSTLKKVPLFSKEFEPGIIRDTLTPLLEMRSLLPVCKLDYEIYHLNIINKDKKITLRLLIEEHNQLNNRVLIQPVKGYDKAAEHIAELLPAKLGLTVSDKLILVTALQLQGRKPKDYSSKLNINLDPDMRADIAGKYIYSHLLKAIKTNEQGTIADTDSEFLHDFRVAVRRTRAGLSQIKGILPANISAYYSDFFSWLGQMTGPTRDLDVYLLNFERYKSSLPASTREDLNPLYDFLLAKQQKSQKELAKKLQSAMYLSTLAEWEQYLKEPSYKKLLEQNAKLSIKELADRRIWKIFTRVLQEGNAITDSSPSDALHDLRKSCKKLRYLMEFFQSLYPEQQIKYLIKNLKGLQEVLGDFQDYAVQEHSLKLFSGEMMTLNTPANTFLAMGMLIQDLDAHRRRARQDFSSKFEDFKQEENQSIFKLLFAPSKSHNHQHEHHAKSH
ncbi:MAG: CHAD domain-containing protein [Methylobacter sp.]|nr:MAG: CHAD domain-containing protein [Methylobacter sp.]